MTNVQAFNKPFLNKFRMDFDNAVKDLEKKYGITIELGNISFSETEFNGKLKVAKILDSAEVKAKEKAEFAQVCFLYDLKESDYGKTFTHQGDTYKLVALNTRAPKKPFICENLSNNQRYRFPENLFRLVALK